jgi:hypothetical protein
VTRQIFQVASADGSKLGTPAAVVDATAEIERSMSESLP